MKWEWFSHKSQANLRNLFIKNSILLSFHLSYTILKLILLMTYMIWKVNSILKFYFHLNSMITKIIKMILVWIKIIQITTLKHLPNILTIKQAMINRKTQLRTHSTINKIKMPKYPKAIFRKWFKKSQSKFL